MRYTASLINDMYVLSYSRFNKEAVSLSTHMWLQMYVGQVTVIDCVAGSGRFCRRLVSDLQIKYYIRELGICFPRNSSS